MGSVCFNLEVLTVLVSSLSMDTKFSRGISRELILQVYFS